MMTANPADAVREAHNSLVRVKASRLSTQHADDLLAIEDGIDALTAELTEVRATLDTVRDVCAEWKAKHDRLAALAGAAPVAWYVELVAPGFKDNGTKLGPYWKKSDAEEWAGESRSAQIVAMHRAGRSLRAIGRDVGLSHEGVRLVLIAAGIVAGKARAKRVNRPKRIDARKALRMLRFHPLSVVADAMKVTQQDLILALNRHGRRIPRSGGRLTR